MTTQGPRHVGIFLPSTGGPNEPPGDVVAAARHAENLGFESVWVVDQLVHGTPMTTLDSVMVLAAVAPVTERVKLGFGVLVAALRPTVWVGKQIASLQHLSGDRVILGIGVGEDRHPGSWGAAGVPKRERGRRTDAALAALPDLIAGRPCQGVDGVKFQLKPGATVPPILVGGVTEAALVRAVDADGWFSIPMPPAEMAALHARLGELAAARNRPTPPNTTLVMGAVTTGDPTVPDRQAVVDLIADPEDKYVFPAEYADAMVVAGPPAFIADHLAALGEVGVHRAVFNPPMGDWFRQAELLAEAAGLLS